MKTIAVIAFLASSAPALAALPPYWDSVRRIEVAMTAPEVAERVKGPIVSIWLSGDLSYDVASVDCTARVELRSHSPGRPGPNTYTVKSVSRVACR